MTDLSRAVEDYIALRRSLGFRLGPHPRLLADFVAYVKAAGAETITIQLAVSWAAQPSDGNPGWWSQRLGVVRGFAAHLRAFDPDTEVPPIGLLPRRSYRPEPYVYLPEEITALMAAARAMADPLRAATLETLIGLIASCGLRPGEALGLKCDDLDWTEGLLDISNAKFNKHRKVPVHPSTLDALAAYAQMRDRYSPHPSSATFFVSKTGTRLIHTKVDNTFAAIARRAGLPRPGTVRPPRLHDLRHFFAISAVVSWYRAGLDVNAQLPLLSTVLGHADPANSYWYLSATPELLALAASRRQHARSGRP
jgi:integrase/recombinase XerD